MFDRSDFGRRATAPVGQGRAIRGAAVLTALALSLTACQTATDTATGAFERPSLADADTKLPPFAAPDKTRGVVLSFLPFSGVPVNTADAIYKTVRSRATVENVTLALRLDEPATYRIRTYINAVGGSDSSTFVFIVEIYDTAGKRVHRFVGQEYGPGASGDPWSGIDTPTIKHIGERMLDGVKSWLTRSGA